MLRTKGKLFLGVALAAVAVTASPTVAQAQVAGEDRTITLAIPAQPLSDALRQLAEASGLQLVYDTKITDGKTSPGVSGATTSRAALAQLLAGSGLSFQFSGDRTVIITASAGDGVRSIGVVNVEGVGGNMPFGEMVSPINGINGSRDVEATEGTGSYTSGALSIVSKIPTSIRETPQSVSVITSQRLIDQNLIRIRDVLDQLPGVASVPGSTSEEFNIYSRGFKVNTYSFDGGAPLFFDSNRPVLDISEFDSIQLIRGADGLFGGYGDPGGSLNLVRKKPLDHFQVTYQQDIGSFSNFREEGDVTGPITADHKLRARLVVAETDRKFFYTTANEHKTSVYGTLEYDLTPTTLVNFGISYVKEHNVANQGGLPRYTDGTAIDFPISTCLCVPYAHDDARKTELIATVSQKITDSISTKLNITYSNQKVDDLYYHISSLIQKNVFAIGTLTGFDSPNPQRSLALDYTINGAFRLFGRHDTFTIGGNYRHDNGDGGATYNYPSVTVPDVFHFNPDSYPEPTRSATPDLLYTHIFTTIYGIYGNVRIELLKGLRVATGLRFSGYAQGNTAKYSYSATPVVTPTLKDHSHSSPNVGVTYDVFHNFTLYGSYESIYQPQDLTRSATIPETPPPVTGFNEELGIKWQSTNKLLNGSVAYYKGKKYNVQTIDFVTQTDIPRLQDSRTQGFDVELSGQIMPNVQLSANFSHNINSLTVMSRGAVVENPLNSVAPRNLVKTFINYRGKSDDLLGRMIIGGGVYYRSSAYNSGNICSIALTPTNTRCPFSSQLPYAFTTSGYTTADLKLGYRLTDHVELGVNATNITNKKAYIANPASNTSGYNFYIDPLTVVGSVRLKW